MDVEGVSVSDRLSSPVFRRFVFTSRDSNVGWGETDALKPRRTRNLHDGTYISPCDPFHP